MIEGNLYVVQRMRYRLVGTVITPDRIEGTLEWEGEHIVLGATSPLLEGDWRGKPDTDPSRSYFVLQRIDSSWDCATSAT